MSSGYKKIRSVRLPYRKQGEIYFTLLNYRDKPAAERRRIDAKIRTVAGGERAYEEALRMWLLREGVSCVQAAEAHNVSERSLYYLRKRLYESW